MKTIFKTVLLLFVLAMLPLEAGSRKIYPDYDAIVDRALQEPAVFLYKQYGFKIHAMGGPMMEGISGITFFSHMPKGSIRENTVGEVRILFLQAYEMILEALNRSEELRPHLNNHPLGAKTLHLFLSIDEKPYQPVNDGTVAYVLSNGREVVYSDFNSETERYSDMLREPYEEAIHIYNEQKGRES